MRAGGGGAGDREDQAVAPFHPKAAQRAGTSAAEALVLHFRRLKALPFRKEPATLTLMIARSELSAALHELTPQDRAGLAVELIDSLGDEV